MFDRNNKSTPIKDYLEAKNKIANTSFLITSEGKGYYEVGGLLIPEKKFVEDNPIPYLEGGKGFQENCDRTKNFIANKKTY